MQRDWNMPDGISLRNRTTRVWVELWPTALLYCDVSSSIAGRLATGWYRVHNSHFRHPRVEAMSSRATDVPEASPVLRRHRPPYSLRQGNNITTRSDDEVWRGWR